MLRLPRNPPSNERETQEQLYEISEIDRELSLLMEAWPYLEPRLLALEEKAMKELVNGPMEGVIEARAEIRLVRHLMSLPDLLRADRARLEETLNGD